MPRKKKTEVEKVVEKVKENAEEIAGDIKEKTEKVISKIKEKTSESKRTGLASEAEEFPDIDIGIDVFSPTMEESEEKKKKGEKETWERKKTLEEEKEEKKPEEKKEELEKKLEELKKKAKKLAEKIEIKNKVEVEDVKEELKGDEKEKNRKKRAEKTLFPLDDYVKYSAHLGTKAITPKMRQFVYKRRADGLAVLNTNSIDEKLKEASEFLASFLPENIFLACKREAGWQAAKKFSEATGIKVFTKKYPAGIITNMQLTTFFEIDLVIVCDPWLDKNALNDAVKIKKPVIALCDTNNLTTGATKVIPCNNKAGKSLGLILYLLAREYLKARGKEKEAEQLRIEDFAGEVGERSLEEPSYKEASGRKTTEHSYKEASGRRIEKILEKEAKEKTETKKEAESEDKEKTEIEKIVEKGAKEGV